MKILLVEDHADSATAYCRLLLREGYAVDIAGDLRRARELCAQHEYDLLISDVTLPDGDGVQFFRELHASSATPAIAVTGNAFSSDVQRSLDAGFLAHLTKPVDVEHLLATIRTVAAAAKPAK